MKSVTSRTMRLMRKRLTEETHPAWLREYREEQIANLKAKVGFCFRPIVLENGYRKGRPEAEGSCILVRLNGMRYLMSAAHVLHEIKSRRTFVWTKHGMVELRAGVLLTTVPSETKVFPTENTDFAILALDDTLYPEFEDSDFLSEAEIDFDGKTKADRVYVGIGFPVCLAKRGDSPTAINLPYITYAGPGKPDVLKRKKLSPEQYVAFEFDRINSLIRGGTRQTAPKPTGMSGGPIFRLDHTGNGNHELIGIMTDWLEHKQAILGAHIGLCREALSGTAESVG